MDRETGARTPRRLESHSDVRTRAVLASPAIGPGPGAVIGRYVVIDRIGHGGIGAVLLAYDPQLARRVAIKVIRTGIVSQNARARMVREARAMAQLSHPNVVAIYDVGTHDDNVYLAMEYVEGETLETWMRTRRSLREVLGVMKQAGRGLAAAHAAGIVHRDFKPSNIVIAKDARVRVLDFGIALGDPLRDPRSSESLEIGCNVRGLGARPNGARGLEALRGADVRSPALIGERLTEEGAIVGTVGYFAPEAVFDQPSDARADIFSFCVTLWCALTGRSPFPNTSTTEYLDAIFCDPRERLRDPRVPEWLAKAIERGLRTSAADRYSSVEELLDALDDSEAWKAPIAIAVLGLAIAVTACATMGRARRDAQVGEMCRAEADAIATSWSPSVRESARAAMLRERDSFAGERTERTILRLDEYARTWSDEQAASCEATLIAKTQTEEAHAKRSQCLIEGRMQLEIVGAILGSDDPRIHRQSLAEASALPAPRLCTELAAAKSFVVFPSEPAARERAFAARREVLKARVLIASGALTEAEQVAGHAIALARADGEGALEASGEHVLGTVLAHRFEDERALLEERRAAARAESVAADHVGGLAAASAASLLVDRLKRDDEARAWQELARGKLARLGVDPILEQAIVRNDVRLAAAHDLPRALEANLHAIDVSREIYSENNPDYCSVVAERGALFRALGDDENAVSWQDNARACRLRAVGPNDPERAADPSDAKDEENAP